MDPTWPALQKSIMNQGKSAVAKVEPRLVTGAGRGLFANDKINPLQTLISIPGRLLLNAQTLGTAYPSHILPQKSSKPGSKTLRMTSIQLLSMHIYRWRCGVSDRDFDAYLKSLPVSFFDHPLTVLVTSERRQAMLELLPIHVTELLEKVENRLKADWEITTKIFGRYPNLVPPHGFHPDESGLELKDFLWAWLNVNTRCLYHKLGFVNPEDNITMCPLLDFANHTPLQFMSITQDEFPLGNGMAFSSAIHLRPGDEVHLRYGGHSNEVLFTEYGFVLGVIEGAHIVDGEMSVDEDVEEMMRDCQDLEEKVQLLKNQNYWGEWTLHVEDGIGRPSFRLIPAFRLLHISLLPTPDREFKLWEDTLLGLANIVSQENEDKARASLTALCQKIIRRSEKMVPLVQSGISSVESFEDEGYLQVLRMTIALWDEQRHIAEAVQDSVANGEEF